MSIKGLCFCPCHPTKSLTNSPVGGTLPYSQTQWKISSPWDVRGIVVCGGVWGSTCSAHLFDPNEHHSSTNGNRSDKFWTTQKVHPHRCSTHSTHRGLSPLLRQALLGGLQGGFAALLGLDWECRASVAFLCQAGRPCKPPTLLSPKDCYGFGARSG